MGSKYTLPYYKSNIDKIRQQNVLWKNLNYLKLFYCGLLVV